jgi:hypothetical protein
LYAEVSVGGGAGRGYISPGMLHCMPGGKNRDRGHKVPEEGGGRIYIMPTQRAARHMRTVLLGSLEVF